MLVIPGVVAGIANMHWVSSEYPFLTEIFPASDLADKIDANFAFHRGCNLYLVFLLSIAFKSWHCLVLAIEIMLPLLEGGIFGMSLLGAVCLALCLTSLWCLENVSLPLLPGSLSSSFFLVCISLSPHWTTAFSSVPPTWESSHCCYLWCSRQLILNKTLHHATFAGCNMQRNPPNNILTVDIYSLVNKVDQYFDIASCHSIIPVLSLIFMYSPVAFPA